MSILGKGKRAKVAIDLTDSVSYALEEWLNFHPYNAPGQPLSCRTQPGGRIEREVPSRLCRHYSLDRL